jgi:hypothetical protein
MPMMKLMMVLNQVQEMELLGYHFLQLQNEYHLLYMTIIMPMLLLLLV